MVTGFPTTPKRTDGKSELYAASKAMLVMAKPPELGLPLLQSIPLKLQATRPTVWLADARVNGTSSPPKPTTAKALVSAFHSICSADPWVAHSRPGLSGRVAPSVTRV